MKRKILIEAIEDLRFAFRKVKDKYPFKMDGIVVLPDHIHSIWRLPETDSDFSLRWRLIKYYFTQQYRFKRCTPQNIRLWQKRFWEHTIQNDTDWKNHMDYLHYNPVKHGYVKKVSDWKHSSFSSVVTKGLYRNDWGDTEPIAVQEMTLE